MSVKDRIIREIKTFQTKRVNRKKEAALKDVPVSVFCNNCTGGVLLHDFNKQFDTPLINAGFYADDFYELLMNLPAYMACPLTEDKEKSEELHYPIGNLNGLMIRFPHDKTFEEVLEKWNRRKERIDYDHIFVIWVGYQNELPEDKIERIKNVPYPKVVFLNHERKDLPFTFYIKGFEDQAGVGHVWDHQGLSGKKYYDQFPIVSWFKKEKGMEDYL